jgi:hypothetical protein
MNFTNYAHINIFVEHWSVAGDLTMKSSIPLVLDVKETNIDWRELPPPERDIQKMILVIHF